MLLGDHSGQSSHPFWHGVRGRSGRSMFKVQWNLSPPQVHTLHVHLQRGLPRFSNEVRVHWLSSPPFGFPFSSLPLRTLLISSLLSCPPVFMFCPLILSFVCAHSGPGLSVYVHFYTHFQHRFQVAQVLTMRWGSSVVPVHLVPFSSQLRTFLSCLVFSSCLHLFVLAACTRAHLPLP